jgi:hypothetical protein
MCEAKSDPVHKLRKPSAQKTWDESVGSGGRHTQIKNRAACFP